MKPVAKTIDITIEGSRREMHPLGITVGSLLPGPFSESGLPYVAALVNNDTASLSYPISVNSEIRFLTMADSHGWRIYRRSLSFLLAKAVHDLYPEADFWVEHSFGPGLYCSFHATREENGGITDAQLSRIAARMRELIQADLPIERRKIAFVDAVREFETAGQKNKLNLLKYRNPPHVVLHWCQGFSDLAHGPLAPRTGVLDRFELIRHPPGFVLQLPERTDPFHVAPFEDQPHLFQIFQEHKEWGRILGVNTVGRLNELIAGDDVEEFVRTAEALHEKKLAQIATRIAAQTPQLRIVLVSGPSASGKTTFAKKLATHLRVNGLRPVTLGLDDYFVGIDRNPLDENGKPDFEHIEAVDLKLFNQDLLALIDGREIRCPTFNFETKQREYRGRVLRLEPGQILIVEGIHGLNPRLTHMIPAEAKCKIYVSALTQLSVDSNNRISTTDNRLVRRMVRDHKFRGHSALETLQLWPSVRRGERTWIFPFQKEADATFNSALDYELAVLKPYVEPLLMQVKPDQEEYAEARRLSEFLLNFLAIPTRVVPSTSILREYIGGSAFRY